MSWRNRKLKAFNRVVSRLKKAPMYMIGDYIVIDESACYDKKFQKGFSYKEEIKQEYERQTQSGQIGSAHQFDNYFNPDLTLNLTFETNRDKLDKIVKSSLDAIASEWHARLQRLYPDSEYTLVQYYDSENSEWYLDFYNGKRQIEDTDDGRITNIQYKS